MSDFRQNPTWPIPPDVFQNRIADLERQLAEKQAEIEAMRTIQNPLMLEYRKQLGEAEDEISAIRPIVDACKARYERHNKFPGGSNPSGECICIACQWYRDYLERKQK